MEGWKSGILEDWKNGENGILEEWINGMMEEGNGPKKYQ